MLTDLQSCSGRMLLAFPEEWRFTILQAAPPALHSEASDVDGAEVLEGAFPSHQPFGAELQVKCNWY